MRISETPGKFERVDPVMTPMIDVCFQIIIFFIANMRIILPEGDFDVTMPRVAVAAAQPGQPGSGSVQPDAASSPQLPAIQIQLFADANGDLAGIQMGDRSIGSFRALRRQIRAMCASDQGPAAVVASRQVQLNFDYNLKYQYVMEAVSNISGYLADDKRTVIRLIENIKFGTPRKPR